MQVSQEVISNLIQTVLAAQQPAATQEQRLQAVQIADQVLSLVKDLQIGVVAAQGHNTPHVQVKQTHPRALCAALDNAHEF